MFGYLIFYKFKSGYEEEAIRAIDEIKKELEAGISIIGEYDHVWGTKYNRVLIVETDTLERFHKWWMKFKDRVYRYLDESLTVIGHRIE